MSIERSYKLAAIAKITNCLGLWLAEGSSTAISIRTTCWGRSGIIITPIVTVISVWIPDAYNVTFICKTNDHMSDAIQNNIYYTFMTFTTTGYGDILPNHPLSKSLAVLISVCGQLYIAIIIAMLVGKYASTGGQNSS